MKMPHKVLGRLKYITKKGNSVKGLILGDRYNNDITDGVITGVLVPKANATVDDDEHINAPYKLIDDDPAIDADSANGTEIEELENYEVDQEENNNITDEGEATQPTAPENAADEV